MQWQVCSKCKNAHKTSSSYSPQFSGHRHTVCKLIRCNLCLLLPVCFLVSLLYCACLPTCNIHSPSPPLQDKTDACVCSCSLRLHGHTGLIMQLLMRYCVYGEGGRDLFVVTTSKGDAEEHQELMTGRRQKRGKERGRESWSKGGIKSTLWIEGRQGRKGERGKNRPHICCPAAANFEVSHPSDIFIPLAIHFPFSPFSFLLSSSFIAVFSFIVLLNFIAWV